MRGFRHWRWHLDEMYVKVNGEMVYLWHAVDQEGEILESHAALPTNQVVTEIRIRTRQRPQPLRTGTPPSIARPIRKDAQLPLLSGILS